MLEFGNEAIMPGDAAAQEVRSVSQATATAWLDIAS